MSAQKKFSFMPESERLPLCIKTAGRPRAADAEQRTQELLETAAHLFMEKGYSNVSLEMIAKQARVAVRTIYVKFGGKAGLFMAVINAWREHFLANMEDLDTTARPLREILTDFSLRFMEMINTPVAVATHRMVIAESLSNPELGEAFFEAGPKQTREILLRLFLRPDIRAQLRDDMPAELMPVHLLNCIMGDQLKRHLLALPITPPDEAEVRQQVEHGLNLFLDGTLRKG
jgi:AcrR family transcriptional regulator